MTTPAGETRCLPVTGIAEVSAGDDLGTLLASHFDLLDGDILVVTSKVLSKAEGRVVTAEKLDVLEAETDRVVARRGTTSIVRTHHGLVMAGGGIDNSNTAPGTIVLLPVDPDGSAARLRDRLSAVTGRNVAVVVSDTCGRPWRNGQTDIAIGAAGLEPLHDYAGRTDDYGNLLVVTAPAVADEIAGAADLVKGKLGRCPAAVLRGLPQVVLPPGENGPGAAQLVRDEGMDMFGLGTREAVLGAVRGSPGALRGFGSPAAASAVVAELGPLAAGSKAVATGPAEIEVSLTVTGRHLGRLEANLTTVCFAMGWLPDETDESDDRSARTVLRFRPGTP